MRHARTMTVAIGAGGATDASCLTYINPDGRGSANVVSEDANGRVSDRGLGRGRSAARDRGHLARDTGDARPGHRDQAVPQSSVFRAPARIVALKKPTMWAM